MPRITRNSSRLANNNGSTTTSPSELLSPSSSVRTRSQAINEDEEPIVRRSTRRAALDAKARIAEESRKELERKRRSRRVAAAAQQQRQLTSPVARRQQQSQQRSSPLVNLDLKPAALPSGVGRGGDADKNVGAQVLLKSDENAIDDDLSQLKEFTCVICMDKPDTLVDLATISGCTHKFCFDCIDKVRFSPICFSWGGIVYPAIPPPSPLSIFYSSAKSYKANDLFISSFSPFFILVGRD